MVFNDGTPLPEDEFQLFARYATIDSLFDFTGKTLRSADEIQVEYDPTYGFPAKVQIDFLKQAVDDELSLSVTNFQLLP